jgi:serine/threonine-protein kinase RsbW
VDLVLQLEIPASAEFVALVRLVIASLASARRQLQDERIDDLKLAVSEACTNAIEAHRSSDVSLPVCVRAYEGAESFVVTIDDRGSGFDPEALPEHPPVTDPDRLNFERGLGIPLIRTLVDDVEFASSDSGTSVRLTLYGGAVGDDMVDIDLS